MTVYSYHLSLGLQFFFIFGKQFDVIHVHLIFNHFLRFYKFESLPYALPKYVI